MDRNTGLLIMFVSCVVVLFVTILAFCVINPPDTSLRDVISALGCFYLGFGMAGGAVLVVGGLIADWILLK